MRMVTPSAPWRTQLAAAVAIQMLLPLAILAGLIPFALRMHALVAAGAVFALWAGRLGLSAKEVGLRRDNLGRALKLQAPLTLLFLAMLAFGPSLGIGHRFETVPGWGFFVFYVLISSPCQEFLYRAFLHALAVRAELRPTAQIALLTIPYVWVHVIYRDVLTLAFTAVVGIVWCLTYRREPNLVAVALSHALLGVVTIALGIV